jgi:hypothetical protein
VEPTAATPAPGVVVVALKLAAPAEVTATISSSAAIHPTCPSSGETPETTGFGPTVVVEPTAATPAAVVLVVAVKTIAPVVTTTISSSAAIHPTCLRSGITNEATSFSLTVAVEPTAANPAAGVLIVALKPAAPAGVIATISSSAAIRSTCSSSGITNEAASTGIGTSTATTTPSHLNHVKYSPSPIHSAPTAAVETTAATPAAGVVVVAVKLAAPAEVTATIPSFTVVRPTCLSSSSGKSTGTA